MPRSPLAQKEKPPSTELHLARMARRIVNCAEQVLADLGTRRAIEEYESALDRSMRLDQLQFARQYPFGIPFDGPRGGGFYADFVVDGWILLELKAAPALTPQHSAEARRYLRESGCKLCLLINFGRQPLQVRRFKPQPGAETP
jgi:GxxExxY protein